MRQNSVNCLISGNGTTRVKISVTGWIWAQASATEIPKCIYLVTAVFIMEHLELEWKE